MEKQDRQILKAIVRKIRNTYDVKYQHLLINKAIRLQAFS